MFWLLSVCLSVCLTARWTKKVVNGFWWLFLEAGQMIRFRLRSESRSGSRIFKRIYMVDCIVNFIRQVAASFGGGLCYPSISSYYCHCQPCCPLLRDGNGSSFVTHDPCDPSHSWPMTHMTHDSWPVAITSFHPTHGTRRGVAWWYWTTLSVLRAKKS